MNPKAKTARRQNIRYGIRQKISGTAAKPRLSVFRSNSEIYAQLIDDVNGSTLAAASSKNKSIVPQKGNKYCSLSGRRTSSYSLVDHVHDIPF